MEKLICSCCSAAIVPTIMNPFLTCEYCDTAIPNPYYNESTAKEAAKPTLEATCISELLEMGNAQNLSKLDPDCFGSPINGIDTARAGLSISDADQVYFLYEHIILLLGFSDGLALTDSGLYYKSNGEAGRLSWEAFITGAISCVDCTEDANGALKIGSAIEIAVKSEKDSRLARFLVDFHNHVYHLHTGETAPASWAVTEPVATSQADDTSGSLLGSLLPGLGALLGTSAVRRQTIVKRVPTMHPTSRPTVQMDRRNHVQPPRPLHSQPHHRSAPNTPGSMGRPSGPSRPGMGGPGGQRSPGGPGHSGRPGGMGGQRGPGGRGRR